MVELDERAKEVGIVMVNELGLDPGIDHMAVMKVKNYYSNFNTIFRL